VHRRLEEILRLLERGAGHPVSSETIVEERLRSFDARLRRLEGILGRETGGLVSKLLRLVATTSRPVPRAGRALLRSALRRVRLARDTNLASAEWMFQRELVRRPALEIPAVAVVVDGGEDALAAARAWAKTQSLLQVRIAAVEDDAGWLRRLGCRWRFHLPLPVPKVSSTFLEMHLWTAATEDLVFTAARGPRGPSIVLRREDLGLNGVLPAAEKTDLSVVIGRTLPLSISCTATSAVRGEEPWLRSVAAIGDRWVRREAYLRAPKFSSRLTPLDTLIPRASADVSTSRPTEIVALVPTLSGAGPAGFVRRLAEVLEPRRAVHIVSLDTRDGVVEGESPDGPAFSYSLGSILDPVLHLSVLEHLASRTSRAVFLDFTPPDGDGDVPRMFRLRNPSVVTINAGWRRFGKVLDPAPPFALPPSGKPGPVSPSAREAARARLGIPDGATAVVLLDVLDKDARAEELVHAAAQLEPQGGWFFVIAGDGPLRPFLRERVSSLRLACSRVLPSSSSPENDLAAADILCAPAGPPGNPNVLLQALALGIPTVASAGSVRPLGLEEGVLALDDFGNASNLTAALLSLASPAARMRLSEKAIAAACRLLERHDLVGAWRETIDRLDGEGA
jgi:hypothetical protein